jgi:hypothetical protein
MKKTEDELTEETEEPYYLRRLYMRDYFRELRTVILTHKNFNEALLHKAKVANLQNQEIMAQHSSIKMEANK